MHGGITVGAKVDHALFAVHGGCKDLLRRAVAAAGRRLLAREQRQQARVREEGAGKGGLHGPVPSCVAAEWASKKVLLRSWLS